MLGRVLNYGDRKLKEIVQTADNLIRKMNKYKIITKLCDEGYNKCKTEFWKLYSIGINNPNLRGNLSGKDSY